MSIDDYPSAEWKAYHESLSGEDQRPFEEMLHLSRRYYKAFKSNHKLTENERLLLSVLFMQHKMLRFLSRQVERFAAEEDAPCWRDGS